MKKRLISLLLALLLLVCLFPAASADSTVDLGRVTAGTEQKLFIVNISEETENFITDSVPSGCQVVREEGRLYLSGTPAFAGSYEFTVDIDESTRVVCSITVEPAAPTVKGCEDVSCAIGSSVQLSVTASANDGGTLSYQWYINTQKSSSGGYLIGDKTGASFTPNTDTVGSYYYYCTVTNTNNGFTSSVTSDPITLKVVSDGPQSISVRSMPSKTEYTVGDMIDVKGLVISVAYADREETLTADYTLDPVKFTAAGVQSVTVKYGDLSCSFPVNVKEKVVERKLEVISRPTKVSYCKGDWLDTKGLKLRVTEGDKKTEVSSGFECSPTTLNSAGTQIITVTYDGLEAEFPVEVEDKDREISISVKSMPTKVNYTVGESLDPTGLILTLTTSKGTNAVNSGYTTKPASFTAKGRQLVEVRYHDLSCTFVVNVTEAKPEPSPSPTPEAAAPTDIPAEASPSPVIPTPTPLPTHASDLDAKPRSHVGAVIILIVSLVALISLCGYVLVMNNGGIEGVKAKLQQIFRKKQ